jgi:hypothetical protein
LDEASSTLQGRGGFFWFVPAEGKSFLRGQKIPPDLAARFGTTLGIDHMAATSIFSSMNGKLIAFPPR